MNYKTIFLAADHGGFEYKEQLKAFLSQHFTQLTVEDLGAERLDPDDDYPDFGIKLGQHVAKTPDSLGIALCRNGQGICVAANKVKGIWAVTAFTEAMAGSTRTDDDANVLCLPADYLDLDRVKEIAKVWLMTSFSGHVRHKRRIEKVQSYEQR